MINLLLAIFLISTPFNEITKIIATTHNVFFKLEDDKINLINYDGELLNSIHLHGSTLPVGDVEQLTKDYKYFHSQDNQIEVVSIPHGFVYRSTNDTLKRVDVSFAHSMTSFSNVFKKNDTIFKFGGYGYWSNRNFFTFFSDESRQWEFYPISDNSKTPPGLSKFVSFLSDQGEYFVLQGAIINQNNGLTSYSNTHVWRFDFENKTWFDMGVSNLPKLTRVNFYDNTLLLAETEAPYSFLSIDLTNNSYTTHKIKESTFDIFGENVILNNDSIYNYYNNFVIKKPFEKAYFSDDPASVKSIYVNSATLFSGLYDAALLSIIVIFSIVVFIRYQKNQSPRISELGIRYKGVSYHLSKKEKLILSEIILNETVSSQRMYDLVENTDLSYPQNNKIKNDTIKKLNKKVEKILGVEDFISSKKLEEDQRVLIYFKKSPSLFVKS